MFLTMEHAEVPVGALLKGAHMWRYVEYMTARPWFHVAVLEHHDDFIRPTIYMLKDLEDLLELAGAKEQGWEIKRVHLVSPGDLNGSGDWQMDELKEILQVHVEENFSLAYVLRSGITFYEDHRVMAQVDTERRIIFALD